ncbi:hypothetical protein OQA88_5730 [Cercophora sp. LCS_1]
MARLRIASLPASLLALLSIALVGANAASPSPQEAASAPSPSDKAELICHTTNSDECYPKIFQPTDEFQVVHPDQDLPKGLHVRLNVQTGQREAKINVPDEVDPSLKGLPVDSAIVIVDPEEAPPPPPKIPANAPAYDPAGKIKEPKGAKAGGDNSEGSAFHRSLAFLKKGLNTDEALEMLEEISHDIYYGLKIAEDYETVKQLFCLANSAATLDSSVGDDAAVRQARVAALTISSTVQNNPKALAEISKHWDELKWVKCSASEETLGRATFRLMAPPLSGAKRNDPGLAKARISAISGLLKDQAIRKQFLASGGMDLLLEVLVENRDPEWEPAQRKVGFLVLDNFLDENMGAALGEWPTEKQASAKECEARSEVKGDCWDWHANNFARRFKKDKTHWSWELLDKLATQRRANWGKRKGKDEL